MKKENGLVPPCSILLGNMEVLENRIAYDFVKLELQNLIRLWDHMTSLARSCPDLPDCVRLLESCEITRKTNYRIYEKFETAETGKLFKDNITFWKDLSL